MDAAAVTSKRFVAGSIVEKTKVLSKGALRMSMPILSNLSKRFAVSLDFFPLSDVDCQDRTGIRSLWRGKIKNPMFFLYRPRWTFGLLLILCGVSGCAQRMPWNFGHFPMAERMALTDDKQDSNATKVRDPSEPPLPSTLVSPENSSPESQSLASSSRQIKPLTMSDDTGEFVPQSGKYAIPEGMSGDEFAALSRGTPSTVRNTASTSEAMTLAAADAATVGDPEVAPAHRLPELLANSDSLPNGTDTQSFASSTVSDSDLTPLANGMPNPMNSLAMQVDYADATQLRASSANADIPNSATGSLMEAAPASSLAQISSSTVPLADVPTDRFGNVHDGGSSGATPVSYTMNPTNGAVTNGSLTPVSSAVTSALQTNEAVSSAGGNVVYASTPNVSAVSSVTDPSAAGASSATAANVLTRIQSETPTPQTVANAVIPMNPNNATNIPTTIRSGGFRPGSTRNAQLPGTRSEAATTPINRTTASRVWPASEAGATTEVYFTEPNSDVRPVNAVVSTGSENAVVSAEFSGATAGTDTPNPLISQPLSYTPSSDVFQR